MNKINDPRPGTDKPVEKSGYPRPDIRPAIQELHFIYHESLRLSMNVLTEIEKMLKKLREG